MWMVAVKIMALYIEQATNRADTANPMTAQNASLRSLMV
jgi:hypothetical protein